MFKKVKAILLLDSMLGFFLTLQTLTLIPLTVVPTQQKLRQVQVRTELKVALWQKLQLPQLQSIRLNSKLYYFKQRGSIFEISQGQNHLEYDSQGQKFRFSPQ
ncbi:hypothetical protein HU830_08180 [Lactobacillus sp. DCY120]|uniref:Uncharacterized protein n=1 Tax=Bombilactobacillus apium TaxID=2675299 RepID=A0A850R8B9_9LACO|nr:hypothetical protein [Bombilactobacillus apium]NVY97097.1 hypothetical protein [Bombilactobacillus apium]